MNWFFFFVGAASNPDNSVVSDAMFIETTQTTPADNFLAAVSDKSDYDWYFDSTEKKKTDVMPCI